TTPEGLRDPRAAAAALDSAAAAVERAYGALDVAWGDVHRLIRDSLDLPANGAPGEPLGVFRVVGYRADDARRSAAGGDSFVAAIEFGEPPRAFALIGYGNASEPGSPHRTDQLRLFAEQRLRPVWRQSEEVEANTVSRTALCGTAGVLRPCG
ncbi:MAG: penicillin acylase family protein, partial [Longimicrobiales bacterium]